MDSEKVPDGLNIDKMTKVLFAAQKMANTFAMSVSEATEALMTLSEKLNIDPEATASELERRIDEYNETSPQELKDTTKLASIQRKLLENRRTRIIELE